MSDRRRSFNQGERNEIYRRAGGLCEHCGGPLVNDDWEADHRIPFSMGGETSVENGLASCGPCNRKKGARLPDNIDPRPFQRDLCDVALARIKTKERATVALVGAGSGKTLAWLMLANCAFREGLIDHVVVLAPRRNLRSQAELDCGDYLGKCNPPMMGKIIARENIEPLVHADKFGYAATYMAIVADPKMHTDWAKEHAGRFLLVLDEAQFVGLEDEDGGTKASGVVQDIAGCALHAIVLTATPTRSDGRALALCEYGEVNEKGIRPLIWHVRATYKEGVALGYLRPCLFELNDGRGSFTDGEQFELQDLEKRLSKVLRKPDIWQPIVDQTIEQFRLRRKLSADYRCLFAAIDQSHAREIDRYLKSKYPELVTVIAISDESDALAILKAFKPRDREGSNSGDNLVSVAMAYIGYDCPPISVIGNLSSKRWHGWLEQLIMRAGRMWNARPIEEQMMVVVGPNDPCMARFARKFREDSEAGLKERREGPPPPPHDPDDVEVEEAEITGQVCLGLSVDQDLDPEELAGLKELQKKLSGNIDVTLLGEAFRKAGRDIPKAVSQTARREKTYEDRRRDYGTRTQKKLSALIEHRFQVRSWEQPELFRKHIRTLGRALNRLQNVKDADHLTEDQWEERLRILDQWLRQ